MLPHLTAGVPVGSLLSVPLPMAVPTITGSTAVATSPALLWQAAATRRQFMRTCDKLRNDLGARFAMSADADGLDMIPQHPREDVVRWGKRRAACTPTAYVRQITDHYLAHTTRQDPTRSMPGGDPLPDAWAQMIANADGVGTPMGELLKQAGRLSFLEGSGYMMLDWLGTTEAKSLADQQAMRHVLRAVPADDVIAVEMTTGDVVLAAIVRLPGVNGVPFLWRIDGQTAQKAELDQQGLTITRAEAPAPHNYGGCPLVHVGPMPAIAEPVAEYQRAIAVNDSLLRYRMGEDSIPWIVVTGTANAKQFISELEKNPAFSAFEDQNAKAMHIGASVDVAASLRDSIQADEDRLYRVAKVRPVSAQTGSPESGVAQAFRFVDADVELASVAKAMERAENRLAALWCKANSMSAVPVAQWPRTFIPVDRNAEISGLSLVSSSTLPEPIKAREYQRAAAVLYPGDKELAQELEGERAPDPGSDDGKNNSDTGNKNTDPAT